MVALAAVTFCTGSVSSVALQTVTMIKIATKRETNTRVCTRKFSE